MDVAFMGSHLLRLDHDRREPNVPATRAQSAACRSRIAASALRSGARCTTRGVRTRGGVIPAMDCCCSRPAVAACADVSPVALRGRDDRGESGGSPPVEDPSEIVIQSAPPLSGKRRSDCRWSVLESRHGQRRAHAWSGSSRAGCGGAGRGRAGRVGGRTGVVDRECAGARHRGAAESDRGRGRGAAGAGVAAGRPRGAGRHQCRSVVGGDHEGHQAGGVPSGPPRRGARPPRGDAGGDGDRARAARAGCRHLQGGRRAAGRRSTYGSGARNISSRWPSTTTPRTCGSSGIGCSR